MFCQYCGNQVKDDALFCDKCGKQTGKNIPPAPIQPQRQTQLPRREAPVVSYTPPPKAVSPSDNRTKKIFSYANEREHTLKMTLIGLFAVGVLAGVSFMLVLTATKLSVFADFIEIADNLFISKEYIKETLRKIFDLSPALFTLIILAWVITVNILKGLGLYKRCKERDFRKNTGMVVFDSAFDILVFFVATFIFLQRINSEIGRDVVSLSATYYILLAIIVLMEILYDWVFIKAAECEAESLYRASVPAGSWICGKCGTENTSKDIFCKKCGENFEKTGWTCTACGLTNKNSDMACRGCGKYK